MNSRFKKPLWAVFIAIVLTLVITYSYRRILAYNIAGIGKTPPKSNPNTIETPDSAPPSLPVIGDPNFKADSLSPEMRVWYDRLLDSMKVSRSYVEYNAKSGNIYRMRTVNKYVSSMLAALRATGDLRFLDEAAYVMDMTQKTLKDEVSLPDPTLPGANLCSGAKDGYLGWVYLLEEYPKDGYRYTSDLFCSDKVPLEDCMAHGVVAAAAYAFHVNRQFNPEYGKRADFWVDYLENHFLAKWAKRAGSVEGAWLPEEEGGFVKRLTHPIANAVRIGYYLNKITGKKLYRQKAEYYTQLLVNHMQINPKVPSAFIWDHQVWGKNEGYQPLNYAEYFMAMTFEMNLENFGNYYPADTMKKFTSTYRDVIFSAGKPDFKQMPNKIDGSGTTKFDMYNLTALARWDTTGTILDLAAKTYNRGNYMPAAYALLALSKR